MRTRRLTNIAVIVTAALLATGCRAGSAPSPTATVAGSGVPIGEAGNLDLDQMRAALLGEPPYPSGWEAQVDEMISELSASLDRIRVPDVSGLDPPEAACTVWRPLVGNTDWAVGAVLERQVFIAHAAVLARVGPGEIRPAAEEALAVAGAAAAEQMVPDGDRAIVSRYPKDAIRTIGLWAVEHCDLPVAADDAPDTEGWTDEEIAQSCAWDREWLENGQEEYRAGPGNGGYAEHPHELEVTLDFFVYPAWHRLARVNNDVNPPTFTVEPIRDAFCDV